MRVHSQHVALPLIFDLRFVIWRLLVYAPFAFWIGWTVQRRRGLLPCLLVVHGLLDLGAAYVVARAS